MPPYKREMPASFAAESKEGKTLGAYPISVLMLSVKETVPNAFVSTHSAAPEHTLCPEGYSGKGGVTSN